MFPEQRWKTAVLEKSRALLAEQWKIQIKAWLCNLPWLALGCYCGKGTSWSWQDAAARRWGEQELLVTRLETQSLVLHVLQMPGRLISDIWCRCPLHPAVVRAAQPAPDGV